MVIRKSSSAVAVHKAVGGTEIESHRDQRVRDTVEGVDPKLIFHPCRAAA